MVLGIEKREASLEPSSTFNWSNSKSLRSLKGPLRLNGQTPVNGIKKKFPDQF